MLRELELPIQDLDPNVLKHIHAKIILLLSQMVNLSMPNASLEVGPSGLRLEGLVYARHGREPFGIETCRRTHVESLRAEMFMGCPSTQLRARKAPCT
jgi:hypothetical protein